MTKCCIILLMLSPLMNHASGQTIFHPFELKGTINIDSGIAILMPVNGSYFYPNYQKNIESDVRNGKFSLKGAIEYPYGFKLFVKENGRLTYISGLFIVDTGLQNISCNVHALRKTPEIVNRSMKGLTVYNKRVNALRNGFSINSALYDSLYHFYQNTISANLLLNNINPSDSLDIEADIIFLICTKEYRNSYASLWELVERLSCGYSPIIDSAYRYFPPKIQNTYTGVAVERKLRSSRVLSYNRIFPRLKLLNSNNQTVIFRAVKPGTRFTLIDLWFSHCPPCISQFSDLKYLYTTYHSKGFNIIGISVDKKQDVGNWKKIITQHKLPWSQYLDMNGKYAEKFSIIMFPTNFLLDNEGRIIARDLQPVQLKSFLRQHLN